MQELKKEVFILCSPSKSSEQEEFRVGLADYIEAIIPNQRTYKGYDIGMLFEVYFFGASPVFETREEAQLIAEVLEKKHHPKRKTKESQIVMILSDHPFPEIDVKEATSILEEYLN